MSIYRLDQYLVNKGLASTRSQADNYIKLGKVELDGLVITKSGQRVPENAVVKLTSPIRYVSRGGLKLESAVAVLKVSFKGKTVLDVGSSTGGFSDYALQHGAKHIIAVDVGKEQMNYTLKQNPKIELHEQTDIRDIKKLSTKVDYCLIDVSFISLRQVLPPLKKLVGINCQIIAMVKPQFETNNPKDKNKGVIKNETIRRKILKDFELWVKKDFKVIDKADSEVAGPKGNIERFYLLQPTMVN